MAYRRTSFVSVRLRLRSAQTISGFISIENPPHFLVITISTLQTRGLYGSQLQLKSESACFYTSQPSSIIRVSFPYSPMGSDHWGTQQRAPLALTIRKRLSTRVLVHSYTATSVKGPREIEQDSRNHAATAPLLCRPFSEKKSDLI